jgi:arginase
MVQLPGDWLRPPEGRSAAERVALLGVPVGIGASRHGAVLGPGALRAAGLRERLENLGFDIEDHGDMSPPDPLAVDRPAPPNARHYHEIQGWTRALSACAYGLVCSGASSIG